MVDIDKIERAAGAAIKRGGNDSGDWYLGDYIIDGVDYSEDADFIAACSPQTILKLIAVVRAASAMIDLYDKLALVLPGSEPDALREALEALS